ncbi:uncharacterized protein LOC143028808 [Oratosquilla oratoria]|uniref:uncharacterized protein LOC143028808 n=1 Tax=Oratosquilla oratoria TaxID=337810 RepID=UPI003F7754D4
MSSNTRTHAHMNCVTRSVEVLNTVRKWENCELKKSVIREQLRFCQLCRNRNTLPSFARVRPPVNTRKAKEEAEACGRRLLKCAIDHHHSRIHRFNRDITTFKNQCASLLQATHFDTILEKISNLSQSKSSSKRSSLESKFQRLLDIRPPAPPRWVTNLSSRQLSDAENNVLARGLNFNVQGKVNHAEFLAAAELGVNLMEGTSEDKQAVRTKIVGALKSKQTSRSLTTEETKALAELRRDRSIVVLTSDKGRSTVVLDKEDYDQKALALLQDTQTYTIVPQDPTKKLQAKVERELKELRENRIINDVEWKKMRPGDSTIPKFYGLPKVHKENIPLRPIVAFRNSPTYHLASYLAKLLRPLVTDSPHMLQNSADFIERIKGLNLRRGDVLVSFDVQSMFTSIPRDLAKSALKSAMEDNRGFLDNQKLSVSELMRLISLCLDSTYFRFRDHTYHQRYVVKVTEDHENEIQSRITIGWRMKPQDDRLEKEIMMYKDPEKTFDTAKGQTNVLGSTLDLFLTWGQHFRIQRAKAKATLGKLRRFSAVLMVVKCRLY